MEDWNKRQREAMWVMAIILSLVVAVIIGGAVGLLIQSWDAFWGIGLVTFLSSMDVCLRGTNG